LLSFVSDNYTSDSQENLSHIYKLRHLLVEMAQRRRQQQQHQQNFQTTRRWTPDDDDPRWLIKPPTRTINTSPSPAKTVAQYLAKRPIQLVQGLCNRLVPTTAVRECRFCHDSKTTENGSLLRIICHCPDFFVHEKCFQHAQVAQIQMTQSLHVTCPACKAKIYEMIRIPTDWSIMQGMLVVTMSMFMIAILIALTDQILFPFLLRIYYYVCQCNFSVMIPQRHHVAYACWAFILFITIGAHGWWIPPKTYSISNSLQWMNGSVLILKGAILVTITFTRLFKNVIHTNNVVDDQSGHESAFWWLRHAQFAGSWFIIDFFVFALDQMRRFPELTRVPALIGPNKQIECYLGPETKGFEIAIPLAQKAQHDRWYCNLTWWMDYCKVSSTHRTWYRLFIYPWTHWIDNKKVLKHLIMAVCWLVVWNVVCSVVP
jgi:hypothetical protein